MSGLTIGFWDNNLGLRGTSVALYTYAKYNEEILGNKSVIFSYANSDLAALDKFELQFPGRVHLVGRELGSYYDVENKLINDYGAEYCYIIKAGNNDGGVFSNIKTLIHAVFCHNDPHGYRYRYVSNWLARVMGYDPYEYAVPHMIEPLPTVTTDLRSELNIPLEAKVFGCYGGQTEFNISFVRETMNDIAAKRNDIYFIFMNIDESCNGIYNEHANFRFLPGSWDLVYKSRFIKTCDAMLHARLNGESFGMACGEFSSQGKPVITYGGGGEAAHIDILGDKALLYRNADELSDVLNNLDSYLVHSDYNCYRDYTPGVIMQTFQRNFLDG